MTETKGMIVDVVRATTDCTNNGITFHHDSLHLVGTITPDGFFQPLPRDMQVFASTPHRPAVVLHPGNTTGAPFLVPVYFSVSEQVWKMRAGIRMFGGNFAALGDSRTCRLVEEIAGHRFYGAIPVHDRFES